MTAANRPHPSIYDVESTAELTEEFISDLIPRTHYANSFTEGYMFSSEEELKDAALELANAGYDHRILHNALMTSLGFFEGAATIVQEVYLHLLACTPNVAMDAMARRWYFDPKQCQKLPESALDHIAVAEATVKSRKALRKKDSAYASGLKYCLNYLKNIVGALPKDIFDAFSTRLASSDYANAMFPLLQSLYPVLDGGLQQLISGKTISAQTWMIAISICLASCNHDSAVFMAVEKHEETRKEVETILNRGWPIIIALGLMIHQLEILQNSAMNAKLYEVNREPAKTTNEIKALNREISEQKGELNSARKNIASLERENKQLRIRLNQAPTSNKDVDGIIERHQQTIREQNAEIERLRSLLASSEDANAELEHQLYLREAAEQEDKPWMDIDLPETGVLFVGGDPNNNKK